MSAGNRKVLETRSHHLQHYEQPQQSGSSPYPSSTQSPTQTHKFLTREDEKIQALLSQYNAPQIAVRPSSAYFPNSKRLQKASNIPLTMHITPFPHIAATDDFPKADFGAKNPVVRCDKCRSYINPFTAFHEGGQSFTCNMCGDDNPTPRHYFVKTDSNGIRKDINERTELHNGVFDIKAGTEYMSRAPMAPIYYFVFDVSQEAVANGSLESISHVLTEFVTNDWFWGDVRTKIGFIAYDTHVHIITLDPKAKRPKITTLLDIEHLSKLPVFEHLLVNLSESKELVLSLVQALPKMYANSTDKGSCLFNAVRVSASILKRTGGQIYAFQSNSNLTKEAGFNKGGINSRDKKHLLCPNSAKFQELTSDMHHAFVSCNLFIFGSQYKDIVTIAELPRFLNGDIHYYGDNIERNHRFYFDFRNSLAREQTWESVFRVRVSNGWRVTSKNGNFSVKSSHDLLSVPNIDMYKSLVYEVELTQDVAPRDVLYIQTALLYTTAKGERRIRVINYGIQLTNNLAEVQAHIDSQAVACALMRKTLESMYESASLFEVKEQLIAKAGQIFLELANNKFKEEELSENNIIFTMAILGFLKHALFLESSWNDPTKIDALNALRIKLNMLSVDEMILYFVPHLFAIHNLASEDAGHYDEGGSFVYPGLLNLSMNSLKSEGVYLMDAGDTLYVLVGSHVESHILNSIFGITSFSQVEQITEDMMYQNMEDPLMAKVSALITEVRSRKTEQYAYLHVIKEGDASDVEYDFYGKLIEDKLDLPNAYNVAFSDFVYTMVRERKF